MTEQEMLEQTTRSAAVILCKAVLELIQKDPHQWSDRPCTTCQTITALIGAPFGCVKYRNGPTDAQKGTK